MYVGDSDNSTDILIDNFDSFISNDQETISDLQERIDGVPVVLGDSSVLQSVNDNYDYSQYYESIIANQEQELVYLSEIRDNSYRLYYFIGGLYVAFAIIIGIKFFKTFLF